MAKIHGTPTRKHRVQEFQPPPPKPGVLWGGLTITHKLKQGQVNLPLPRGALLEGNTVTRGGEDVPAPDGHQLAAFIPPGLVIQDCRIVDESVQLPEKTRDMGVMGAVPKAYVSF